MKIPIFTEINVPIAASAQKAVRTTMDFLTFVFLMIQMQRLIFAIKDTKPTPALIIPL